jgi:hypothetical protein
MQCPDGHWIEYAIDLEFDTFRVLGRTLHLLEIGWPAFARGTVAPPHREHFLVGRVQLTVLETVETDTLLTRHTRDVCGPRPRK